MRILLAFVTVLALGAAAAAQAPGKPAPAAKRAPAAKPAAAPAAKAPAAAAPAANTPVLHIVTAKGTITVETYPSGAPRSFEHILKLVKRHFYDGQAVHRVVAGQLVQFGDPQTRNMMLVDNWGRGPGSGSGESIGVVELPKAHQHIRGTLALAHPGSPAYADSQMFIVLRPMPIWDGKYTIIGQVTSGLAVADTLARGDKISSITVTGAP